MNPPEEHRSPHDILEDRLLELPVVFWWDDSQDTDKGRRIVLVWACEVVPSPTLSPTHTYDDVLYVFLSFQKSDKAHIVTARYLFRASHCRARRRFSVSGRACLHRPANLCVQLHLKTWHLKSRVSNISPGKAPERT